MLESMTVIFVIVLYVPMLFKAIFLRSGDEIVAEQRAAGSAKRAVMLAFSLVLLGLLQWLCFQGELSLLAVLLYGIILYELIAGLVTLSQPVKIFALAEARPVLFKAPLVAELVYFSVLAVWIFSPTNVSFASDDTYMRLWVNGGAYEFDQVTFTCEPVGSGANHFVVSGAFRARLTR